MNGGGGFQTEEKMKLLEGLLNIVRDRLPEEALTQDPTTGEHFLDLTFIDNDEINLTQLAAKLETALTLKAD